jgi:hypothetical protein
MSPNKYLSQILNAVAVYNGDCGQAATEEGIFQAVKGSRIEIRVAVAHAVKTGLLESAEPSGYWLTEKGGDIVSGERRHPVPNEALAVHSDGDLA